MGILRERHDFRRASGTRWARGVPPLVLRESMRHTSVTTTERFYVDIDADATAEMLANLMTAGGSKSEQTGEQPAKSETPEAV